MSGETYTESESMDRTMERSVSTESEETPPYVNACFDEMENQQVTCVEFDSTAMSQLSGNELSQLAENELSQLSGNELSPIKSEACLHEQQNHQDAYAELSCNIVALMNGQTSTALGAYLERFCRSQRMESVTETNEQDESNTNDDENGNFDTADECLEIIWNDKLALEGINQNSQSNSDDDDSRYKCFNALMGRNNKTVLKLQTVDGQIITYNSWTRLKEKLRGYHYPIDQVILQDVVFSSKVMDFFRSVDPVLFTKEMCFNLIDFSKAHAPSAEIAFIDLFQKHFHPKWVQFEGLKGILSEFFARATVDYSLLNSANTIKFLDSINNADPFMLDNDFILRFLHSDKHTSPKKRLIIHHKFLGKNTLKGIWSMLLEKFANDSVPSNPFVFSIQCDNVFEHLVWRCEYNAKTKEELMVTQIAFRRHTGAETAMRYDHNPNGFKVSIVRRAHCRRLRDRKYFRREE